MCSRKIFAFICFLVQATNLSIQEEDRFLVKRNASCVQQEDSLLAQERVVLVQEEGCFLNRCVFEKPDTVVSAWVGVLHMCRKQKRGSVLSPHMRVI